MNASLERKCRTIPAYRDKKKGSWFVVLRYTDFTGTLKQTTKRDFRTKSDVKDYARRFLLQKSHDLTMIFEDFYYLYMSSMETRPRESTMCMKKAVIETRIRPTSKINGCAISRQPTLLSGRILFFDPKTRNMKDIRKTIWRRYTISSVPYSTMPFASMV